MAKGEQELIASLVEPMARDGLDIGPGDDAAVFPSFGDRRLVVSTDVMVEDVHFDLSFMSPFDVGYRALAGALSDLAAMGADPKGYLISLGVPKGFLEGRLHDVYRGLSEAATPWSLPLAGGDTSRSAELFIDVTVLGTLAGEALRRDAARPGDRLMVTGRPGLAALGLRLLMAHEEGGEAAKQAFLRPQPRFEVAWAALEEGVGAADDITDGVAAEVRAVCAASGVGAVLDSATFPALPGVGAGEAERLFLNGGDDLELLLVAAEPKAASLVARAGTLGVPVAVIGEVTEGAGLFVRRNGRLEALADVGYDHLGTVP